MTAPWPAYEFRKFTGSVFPALFGASAFDEVTLLPVAAAVDKTGRFDRNFTDRALRGGLSTTLALWGDAADRAAEADRLKTLHRAVHGFGNEDFAGVRYSALNPQLWNWILLSGMFLFLRSFTPSTGIALTPAQQEAAYRYLLDMFEPLQLAGRNARLPDTHAAATAYYDDVVRNQAHANPFLDRVVARLDRLPLPTVLMSEPLRSVLRPGWMAVRPSAARVMKICSFGIMHPGVRELTGFPWTARHQREFGLYTNGIQLAWRTLPNRVLLEPLAYNRLRYEKLVRRYRSVGLESFAPPVGLRGGCPLG